MACKTEHPLPHLLDNGMSVQRDDSSTQQHVDDNDGILKLHVVGKGGGRMSILTLDPTQSVESKLIFDRVQQFSANGNNEIDLQSLLKVAATQEELKATVHRQKKTIGKLIFGFAATALVLFAVTLGSSLLSGNLLKELYLQEVGQEPDSANGARLLQDASGNAIATGIAEKGFALTDFPSMSEADLRGMTRVTMQVGGAIRHYQVDAVAKRCGVVQVQSQKVSIFIDDSYVSILGVDGERETLAHPTPACDKPDCRRLSPSRGEVQIPRFLPKRRGEHGEQKLLEQVDDSKWKILDVGDEWFFQGVKKTISGLFYRKSRHMHAIDDVMARKKIIADVGDVVDGTNRGDWIEVSVPLSQVVHKYDHKSSAAGRETTSTRYQRRDHIRRLEDRSGPQADLKAATEGSDDALLDASARQLLASPVSPPAFQLQCDDTLEDVLDYACDLDMNYSVQCPRACDCKSADQSIYGCNPYTADSRICCAAILHGVQHPAPFLIHTAGAHDTFKACTFTDNAANRRGLRDVNEVLTQSAGPYPRSFEVFGDDVVVSNISAFRKDDLGCSVDELANDVKMIASTMANMSRAVTALQVEVAELTKRHRASGVAR